MKNILINMPDEVYYELLQLKARMKCDTWLDFVKGLLREQKFCEEA